MTENNLFQFCIYTMRNKKDLDLCYSKGRSGTFNENQIWREGLNLFNFAKQVGLKFLLLLSSANESPGIIYIAEITSITISDENKTIYSFSNLTKLRNSKPLSSLILKSTNKPLSNNYIRPYALCNTPHDLSSWLEETNIPPIHANRKSGQEQISLRGQNVGYSLLNFWQWSSSDLVSNTLRGVLAEYIVAIALEVNEDVRAPWGAYDLHYNGHKIEVKSASYVQSWTQQDYSKISFDIKKTREWNEISNKQADESKRQADIYVFCLLNHKIQATLDPLKLEQWDFYILPARVLDTELGNKKSIGLNKLKKLKPLHASFSDMKHGIEKIISQIH